MGTFEIIAVVTFLCGLFLGRSLGKKSGLSEGKSIGYKEGFGAGLAKAQEAYSASRMETEEFNDQILVQELVSRENFN